MRSVLCRSLKDAVVGMLVVDLAYGDVVPIVDVNHQVQQVTTSRATYRRSSGVRAYRVDLKSQQIRAFAWGESVEKALAAIEEEKRKAALRKAMDKVAQQVAESRWAQAQRCVADAAIEFKHLPDGRLQRSYEWWDGANAHTTHVVKMSDRSPLAGTELFSVADVSVAGFECMTFYASDLVFAMVEFVASKLQ